MGFWTFRCTRCNVCLFADISPAELDALWREPPYTLGGANEHFSGNDIMTQGKLMCTGHLTKSVFCLFGDQTRTWGSFDLLRWLCGYENRGSFWDIVPHTETVLFRSC